VRLFLDHDLLALDFPYDQDQVAEIKQISGAKWDKVSKLWKVPLGSIGEVREFALKHEFEVSEEVLLFTPPKRQAKRGAYLKGDWIFIQIPYDKVIINGVKKIPGITWDKGEVAWRAPVTSAEDTIYWAESFSVPVDATVFQVADEMKSKLEELQQASRSVDAEIEVPLLQGSLLPYQKAGVAYATRAKRSFIADEMGLGKTIQAIATLEYSSEKDDVYPAVIVCPPTLALNWKAEWNRWLPHRRVSVVSNRKDFPEPRTYDVVVVGYSNIQHWEKQLTGHNSYVFDESHYAKTPTAQRTKSAIKMAKSALQEHP
jgi:hypothetical protein